MHMLERNEVLTTNQVMQAKEFGSNDVHLTTEDAKLPVVMDISNVHVNMTLTSVNA